jgi:outer membrane protein OmpA-like peptidoglycan-associated protein
MVFFDFDKSALTPEAKKILASAAQDFKSGKYVRIVVTGHTDTVGTAKYNQKLSERRAATVKTQLQKLGVNPSEIEATGVGKNDLLVPTADGVREAQNRRAEIVFQSQQTQSRSNQSQSGQSQQPEQSQSEESDQTQ